MLSKALGIDEALQLGLRSLEAYLPDSPDDMQALATLCPEQL